MHAGWPERSLSRPPRPCLSSGQPPPNPGGLWQPPSPADLPPHMPQRHTTTPTTIPKTRPSTRKKVRALPPLLLPPADADTPQLS